MAKGTGDIFIQTIAYQNNSIPVHLAGGVKQNQAYRGTAGKKPVGASHPSGRRLAPNRRHSDGIENCRINQTSRSGKSKQSLRFQFVRTKRIIV